MADRTVASLCAPGEMARVAGARSYARGVGYHGDDRVELGSVARDRVEAIVRGTMPYRVALWVDGDELAWSCSCPVGEDGEFCKHSVAVALAIGANDSGNNRQTRSKESRRHPEIDIRAFVESLDTGELVDLVMNQVDADWRLRERLSARAATAAGGGINQRTWRKRLEAAFAPDGDFVHDREAAGWAAQVADVIDALGELVEAGHGDDVVLFAEHAHRLADAAIEYIDDSDGWLGDISARLGALHLRACELGNPDRVALARRLADLELTSELDAFHRAALTYAEALGADGLAEYRRRIEPVWRKLGRETDRWSTRQFRVREAMVGLALASGDPDELVRVKQHDLRTPDDYREIAASLRAVGRSDDAIDWARRGLDTYAARPWQTPPLRELLAQMLRERGDLDGAIDAFWQAFQSHPSVDAYRRLLTEADAAGQRADSQQRSIAALRQRVAENRPDDLSARSIVTVTPTVALVEILLFDGDVDGAWEAATTYGCAERLWLTLARARQDEHPFDAIPIYEREAFAQIETKNNQGYRSAVDLLARIRGLAVQAGRPELFDRLLAEVRTKHKPKRNLLTMLDRSGW